MAGQPAGRALGVGLRLGQRADHRLDLLARDRARPQQPRPVEQRDHRRFQADLTGAAVERGGRLVARLFHGVGVVGGAGPSRAVGRGRHHRPAEPRQQRAGQRMDRNAHRHGVEAGAGQVAHRHGVGDRQHQGQGTGPERLRQRPGAVVEDRDLLGARQVGDVRDQRVEARPALGLEDRRHRPRIAGVARQPVDCLGRQDDQLALAQRLDRGV